jgi:osmotically-inducible protein OsmY
MNARLAILLALGAVTACSTGYRTEEDSEKLRSEIDDRTIESRVRVALAGDEVTRGRPIEVQCVDGTVYLRGALDEDSAPAVRARVLALGVEGVRKVVVRFKGE